MVVAACTDTTSGTTAAETAGATALAEHLTGTEEYLPGLAADFYLPPGSMVPLTRYKMPTPIRELFVRDYRTEL